MGSESPDTYIRAVMGMSNGPVGPAPMTRMPPEVEAGLEQ